MSSEDVVFAIFLVFAGSALLATVALFLRQAMILAYIVMGALVGPAGFNLLQNTAVVDGVAEIGIMFLLYLLGLNLYPQKLVEMLKQATWLTLGSSLIFGLLGFAITVAFGFGWRESAVVGAAMMFSSTILGLKLLPTTALHHRHAGEIIISVLLIQDLIAIALLLMLQSTGQGALAGVARILVGLPLLVGIGFMGERYLLRPLWARFDQIQEYIFLVAIGWCMALAYGAHAMQLSYEIGAFVAGVSLAASPISRFIGESLRPIRDFFLVIFFFTLGARLELAGIAEILIPALVLAASMLIAKPLVFRLLLGRQGESPRLSTEMGARLGQISEFSLLVGAVAVSASAISQSAGYLIQVATLVSFAVSSYWIVMRYPTPISVNPKLRQD